MSQASDATLDDETVAHVAAEVLPVAVSTGDRAFQFIDMPDGSKLEVRVWPDGVVTLTEVDFNGMPLGEPLPELREA